MGQESCGSLVDGYVDYVNGSMSSDTAAAVPRIIHQCACTGRNFPLDMQDVVHGICVLCASMRVHCRSPFCHLSTTCQLPVNYVLLALRAAWKQCSLPHAQQAWRDRCSRLLGGTWAIHTWTDSANRALVASAFPDLLPTYDAYETHIKRVDAVRYVCEFESAIEPVSHGRPPWANSVTAQIWHKHARVLNPLYPASLFQHTPRLASQYIACSPPHYPHIPVPAPVFFMTMCPEIVNSKERDYEHTQHNIHMRAAHALHAFVL